MARWNAYGLRHRGPDGHRHSISADRHVAPGHARLSIIDLLTPTGDSRPQGTVERDGKETWRGSTLASIPFLDQKKVISLLDRIETMDEGAVVPVVWTGSGKNKLSAVAG